MHQHQVQAAQVREGWLALSLLVHPFASYPGAFHSLVDSRILPLVLAASAVLAVSFADQAAAAGELFLLVLPAHTIKHAQANNDMTAQV